MGESLTPHEFEQEFGEHVKALRLRDNIDRNSLCERAGVSLSALKNLESGKGSTLRTLMLVLRALGREEWLRTLAPRVSINPLHIKRDASPRRRASRRARKDDGQPRP